MRIMERHVPLVPIGCIAAIPLMATGASRDVPGVPLFRHRQHRTAEKVARYSTQYGSGRMLTGSPAVPGGGKRCLKVNASDVGPWTRR